VVTSLQGDEEPLRSRPGGDVPRSAPGRFAVQCLLDVARKVEKGSCFNASSALAVNDKTTLWRS
jgi:hypothetical protein